MEPTELERQRYLRAELVTRMALAIPQDGLIQPLPGLFLARSSQTMKPVYGISQPSFCMVTQGGREVRSGAHHYRYDPHNYLLSTAKLPMVSHVLKASEDAPYMGLQLFLDAGVVASVMVEIDQDPPRNQQPLKAMDIGPLDSPLLEATLRLVRLLDCPLEARVLFPLVTREIVFRLLVGGQGHRLRQMAVLGRNTYRIYQALARICQDYAQPLYIEDVARAIGMSVSGFHFHFKEVTGLTPLQFQKQLRLQEARRLLLEEGMDAASAGFRVGYEDPSHFNRDYKRFFGVTPMRDGEHAREGAVGETGF
jgi:AraC-like DNA-binding protein